MHALKFLDADLCDRKARYMIFALWMNLPKIIMGRIDMSCERPLRYRIEDTTRGTS